MCVRVHARVCISVCCVYVLEVVGRSAHLN